MLTVGIMLATQVAPRVESFVVEGVTRQATIIDGVGPAPHPLVIAFHGHGGNMRNASRSFHVQELWPEATVVYPEGLPTKGRTDPAGTKNGWQQSIGENGDRDIKFVDAILRYVKDVDPKRIYAMGHSNGGRFTYVLWANRGDVFAAYGPSGSPATGLLRNFKPAPVFHTAGERDQIVPFPGQQLTINALIRLDHGNISKAKKDGYITLIPGEDGTEVGTYVFPDGHMFPPEAARATVELFKRHHK